MSKGAHRSLVRNPASLCYRLQGDMSFSDAAALPCILTTAWFSLIDTARLQKGETILIHSAAGGVGQMAIQIAQRVGARVLVTVGSPAKRQLLKDQYGISEEDMFSSRDDSFVKGVLAATNGKGVEVVLNSLAGPLLHATWSCLNAFGRFIEIGKRDIHENTKIAMEPFRKNVLFASVDLITIFERNKPLGARIFRECCELVHNGEIKLPATILEVSYQDVVKGFRLLQMGRHTGKVVLVPGKDDMVPVMPKGFRNSMIFSGHKDYLLVGGLGGLGRTLSQWMVRKGAKKITFLSRSGADKAEAKETVDWLRERGVQVGVFKGDVSSLEDVTACVKSIGSSLGGIFQAAMVLQDTPLDTMTYNHWVRCVKPKVDGVKNLHEASLDINLDFFVCFSSVATIIGSKAQANYSAANCFLDAFMRHRRQMGLCGTTMNVGAVSGVGVVSESEALLKIMERLGMDLINEEELLYQLEEAVTAGRSTKDTPEGIDSHQIITGVGLLRPDVNWATKPLLVNLYSNHDFGQNSAAKNKGNLLTMLNDEPDIEKKTEILLDAFLEKIASVLATPRESILPSNPLSAYGLDSIVAVEFRKWFRSVQVDIALFDILGAQSISALVSKAARMISSATTTKQQTSEKTEKKSGEAETVEEQIETSAMASGEITKATPTDCIPLSTFQSRLWFVHSFLEDKSFLNLPNVMRIKGKPDPVALRRTMYEFTKRNAAMRTAYFEGDDFAQQQPLSDFDIDFNFRDLSSEADTERALQEFVQYNRKIEMNVEEGEVSRYSLAKLSEEDWAFVCMMHHISVDRGCLKQIMNQFVSIYDAVKTGKELSSIPSPEFTYVDFTLWHNARLTSDLMRPDLNWWRTNLEGIPQASKPLPFAKNDRPARNDPRRHAIKTNLNGKLFARMKRIASQSSGTPFHFIMSAFRAFCYRYTEEKDLVILMVDGNRPHPDAEDITGFFVNLVPIRLKSDCETTFDNLFAATKDAALDAMAHSGVPFDTIVDIMQVKKTPSHMPIGQISVNYQIHGPVPKYTTADFVVNNIESDDIPTAADIQLEALETPEHSLDLRIEYATALYHEADMDRFLDNFLVFLSSCIKDHRQPIEEVEICGKREVEALEKYYWNTKMRENPWKGQSVLDKITQMASQYPLATAIKTSDGSSVSYEKLVRNAESIASELLEAGVEAGARIGLLALPGVEAVTGMLGVLMTGSCYVALDTDFAEDRLSFMIADAGSKVLLVGPGAEAQAKSIVAKASAAPRLIMIENAIAANQSLTIQRPRQKEDPFYMIYTSVCSLTVAAGMKTKSQ
jgi:NADPH:quinone reductase-like Zn-dependent oxidoreductase/NAD(P)-dependent dehydrogenase (short-subunit alcohol dehydrogenase family)/aryl carrier-like protein